MTDIRVDSWYGDVSNPENSLRVESIDTTTETIEVSVWLLSYEESKMLSTVDLTLAQVNEYIESGQWVLAATPAE